MALPALAYSVEIGSNGQFYKNLVRDVDDGIARYELRGSVCWANGRVEQTYFDDPRKAHHDILTHHPGRRDNRTYTDCHE
jgi:hypothetical protein